MSADRAQQTEGDASGPAEARNRFLLRNKEKLQLNQYWYSAPTLDVIVAEVEDKAKRAAFLSTPSVYFSLKDKELRANSKVFDLDTQWEKDPGFVLYNYKEPENIPEELHHTFDYVVIDPPFIVTEVWELYAKAARLLLVEGTDDDGVPLGKILGTTIGEHKEFLSDLCGLKAQAFQPSIPNLIYQYELYVNYESERLSQPNPEIAGVEHHGKTSYKPPVGVASISSAEVFGDDAEQKPAADSSPEGAVDPVSA